MIDHPLGGTAMTRTLLCALFGWFLLCAAAAVIAQTAPVSDREWKAWVEDVRPFLDAAETAAAKKMPAADRQAFREQFWKRRTPVAAAAGADVRAEIEGRIRSADKRFRADGKGAWNECGWTWVVLGKPDWMRSEATAQHFKGSDPMANFREQDEQLAETWLYRAHPRLPQTPEGISFRFTQECEAFGSPQLHRLLEQAAASYLVTPAR